MDHSVAETIKVSESQADFARRLGVSRQRVNSMLRDGMPIMANGRLDVEACLRWVRANVEPRRGGVNPPPADEDGDDDGIDLTEARRLKILVDTEFAKVLLAKEQGALIAREPARRAIVAWSRYVRDRWLNFGNRYGQQIAAACGAEPKALMAELDKAVRLQLDEIARAKPPLDADRNGATQ